MPPVLIGTNTILIHFLSEIELIINPSTRNFKGSYSIQCNKIYIFDHTIQIQMNMTFPTLPLSQ